MAGWALRIILLLIVLRLVWRFVAGVIDGIAGGRSPRAQAAAGRDAVPLVKDPVCGTYVVREKALSASANGDVAFFCSARCRDQWRAAHGSQRA